MAKENKVYMVTTQNKNHTNSVYRVEATSKKKAEKKVNGARPDIRKIDSIQKTKNQPVIEVHRTTYVPGDSPKGPNDSIEQM